MSTEIKAEWLEVGHHTWIDVRMPLHQMRVHRLQDGIRIDLIGENKDTIAFSFQLPYSDPQYHARVEYTRGLEQKLEAIREAGCWVEPSYEDT